MLDLGWPELLLIAIVLIVVVGPKDLPRVLRSFGRTTTKLRSMAGDFRKQFDEALREAELDEVKGLADEARKLDPRNEIKKHLSPLEEAGRDIRSGLDGATKPKSSSSKSEAPAETKAETKVEAKSKPAAAKPKETEKPAPKAPTAKPADQSSSPSSAKTSTPRKTAAAKPAAKAKTAGTASKPAGTATKSSGTAAKSAGTAKKTNTAARSKKNVGSTS